MLVFDTSQQGTASFFARSGIWSFTVIFARLTKPILQNRLFVHDEFSSSRTFRCSVSLLAMRAFAVAMATTELTTPRFLITIWRKLQTFSSTVSKVRGLPRFKVPIYLSTFGPFFSWSTYFLRSALARLSPNFKWGWDFLNFRTAAPGPFMACQ